MKFFFKKIYSSVALVVIILLSLISFQSCVVENPAEIDNWYADFMGLGTYSSPRTIDLNQDGILDVVIGAGANEFEKNEKGVLAINGINGKLLWAAPCTDQVVGSAVFLNINNDDIPDVVIGGRNAQLYGLNGKNGEQLWKYKRQSEEFNAYGYTRFNFYNPQVIADQDGDGVQDLLVTNGGNVLAKANDTNQRFPGVLLIMSGKDGSIINLDMMPDGKETYMSPLVADLENDGTLDIIFGTGGETIGGSLYRTTLEELKNNNIKKATPLLTEENHGFFAPPALVDITDDGTLDIVGNWHGGKTYAINGATNKLIWQVEIPNTEASNSVAVGQFTSDSIPDFFTYTCMGVWPQNTGIIEFMINGATGEIERQDTLGCAGFSSPVASDFDNDGNDEALLSINQYDCEASNFNEIEQLTLIFDFNDNQIRPLDVSTKSKNVGSTPWLGDLNNNGKLDVVMVKETNTPEVFAFYGLRIKRLATEYPIKKLPTWGAYMGSDGTSIYRIKK